MKLQLQNSSVGPDGRAEDIDVDDISKLEDITSFLEPPTEEEERVYGECRRIIDAYRGPCSSGVSISREYGWNAANREKVVGEVAGKMGVRERFEEGRVESGDGVDVEMT